MDEKELLASVGRKTLEFEKLNIEYETLLLLLSKVLSGEIRPDEVTVDLAARRWTYTANPVPQSPADPGLGKTPVQDWAEETAAGKRITEEVPQAPDTLQ